MTATPHTVEQTNFDAIAEIYDSVFPPHIVEHYLRRRADYVLGQAAVPGQSALDVGAGTGLLAERLSDLGLGVVALDPFPQMLGQLQQRRPAMETVVAHGDDIPLPDATFDLTYSVAVMHHIAEPFRVRRTLSEMVRVTRPGGRILVWDHNPLNPYWSLLMRRVPQDTGGERLGLMPEFVPRCLLDPAATVERMVEATPGLRRFCAHNVVLAIKS